MNTRVLERAQKGPGTDHLRGVIDIDGVLRPWQRKEAPYEKQDQPQGRNHRGLLNAPRRAQTVNAGHAGIRTKDSIMKMKTNVKAGLVCRKAGGQ